jgi:hypothetical protein
MIPFTLALSLQGREDNLLPLPIKRRNYLSFLSLEGRGLR